MNTYRSDLLTIMASKHLAILEAKKVNARVKELTAKAQALNVLADDAFGHRSLINAEAQLLFDVDLYVRNHWSPSDRWRFGAAKDALLERMDALYPVTEEDLVTYVGVLLDLLELAEIKEEPVSAFRFHLRVYYADDYKAMIDDRATELGLSRKK